jgi:beta-glucanase (GH16 family)
MKYLLQIGLVASLLMFSMWLSAQNYQLVWEDNFDGNSLDSSKWNIEENVGIWNTGTNKEFQHYKKENVTVGDDGNGNNCVIVTAKKENYNGYKYTSGRINTKGKMAFRRGKLEAMIKIPNLANGLWPAFWTLGYTPKGWPDCGEIDILEMGHAKGISLGKQNSFLGSHLFWGPYPRDYGKEITTTQDLSQAYYKYTVIWTDKSISTYFNDSSTPFFSMGIDGKDTEEFQNFKQYIIFNMAVGGSVPGIYTESGITATFPSSLFVDWVKVYQEESKIDFMKSDLPLFGQFGIYEDNANVDMRMSKDFDLFVESTGLTTKEASSSKSGLNALAFYVEANQDFELKLKAALPRNVENYSKGSIQFYLKRNFASELEFGVADLRENSAFISLPSTKIPLSNQWTFVYIPLAEIAEKVDLKTLSDLLIVKGNATTSGEFTIDEVVVSETLPAEGFYGIYSNNPNISKRFPLDNVAGFLYNWNNTITFNKTYSAFDGEDVLCFRSSGAAGWWGFGLFSSKPVNLENFANGYLNLNMRTSSKESFKIGMDGANKSHGDVEFIENKDPYGFVRDGNWHAISIPVLDLMGKGLDLSACDNIFTMSGGKIGDIAIDDIYFSETSALMANPSICYPVTLTLTPSTAKIKVNVKKKIYAKATDQFGKSTDAFVNWECSGGSITTDGYFVATLAGVYTITATLGNIVKKATITVESATGIDQPLNDQPLVRYSSETKVLSVSGIDRSKYVDVFNVLGEKVFSSSTNPSLLEIDMSSHPLSTYFVKIQEGREVIIQKFVNN